MANNIQAVRGMNDILPSDTPIWQYVEKTIAKQLQQCGYQEIRFPIVEKTALFKRSVGAVTDIVEKEMYSFEDRNGDHLTLRPEGTAGCVRAGIEHGLFYNQVRRLWYHGPLFRHERPQRGRYRQFHQMGIETFGMGDAALDAEIIMLSASFWRALGLLDHVRLELNTLGSFESRKAYRQVLTDYMTTHWDALDEDSKRRLSSKPLRILDSKNPAMAEIIANAPRLMDTMDVASSQRFDRVCQLLDAAGVKYVLKPTLVRGLDYYCHTVFEWTTEKLGAQGAICAGGRFDGLVAQLGGKSTPAMGFALGLERVVELMQLLQCLPETLETGPDVYCVLQGDAAQVRGLIMAQALRNQGLAVITDCTGGSMKSQFKKADQSQAHFALVLGDAELSENKVVVKSLRERTEQQSMPLDDMNALVELLQKQSTTIK
jgi:histidyl-tRNA synthetase